MQMAPFASTEVKKTDRRTAEHKHVHHGAIQPFHGETFTQKKQKGSQHLGTCREPRQCPCPPPRKPYGGVNSATKRKHV